MGALGICSDASHKMGHRLANKGAYTRIMEKNTTDSVAGEVGEARRVRDESGDEEE